MVAKDSKAVTSQDRVRYTDREVAQILRRAVALQEKQGTGPGRGLSLEEMKDVAREVGVDPRFVVEAAEALVRAGPPGGNSLLGGPIHLQAVQVVTEPFSTGQMQAVIDEIRRITGRHGRASQVADAIEWHGKDQLGSTSVSVSRVGQETRVRVIANRSDAAAVLYTLGAIGAVIGAGAAGAAVSPLGAAVVAPTVIGVLGASWLSLRTFWSRYARRWDERIRSTLGSVVHVLRETGDEIDPQDGHP